MTNLDSILKSRDITLPTKVCIIKVMAFPVDMYGCESWTIKKDWVAKNWCWRRLLIFSWTAWRSNQSILKEINPEYSLEGQMLKLKFQNFGHLMWTVDSLQRTLMLETLKAGERDDRGWDGWMASPIQWTGVWANSRRQWRTRKSGVLQCMDTSRTWLSNWTRTRWHQVRIRSKSKYSDGQTTKCKN